MSNELSLPAQFRNAIRDSELDPTAKLVAYTISTYMNLKGTAYPSKALLSAGAGLGSGKRAVDAAVNRLEAGGFIEIERSKGRSSNLYRARPALLTTHGDAGLNGANSASDDTQPRTKHGPTPHLGAHESSESESESNTSRGRGRANAPDFSEYDD